VLLGEGLVAGLAGACVFGVGLVAHRCALGLLGDCDRHVLLGTGGVQVGAARGEDLGVTKRPLGLLRGLLRREGSFPGGIERRRRSRVLDHERVVHASGRMGAVDRVLVILRADDDSGEPFDEPADSGVLSAVPQPAESLDLGVRRLLRGRRLRRSRPQSRQRHLRSFDARERFGAPRRRGCPCPLLQRHPARSLRCLRLRSAIALALGGRLRRIASRLFRRGQSVAQARRPPCLLAHGVPTGKVVRRGRAPALEVDQHRAGVVLLGEQRLLAAPVLVRCSDGAAERLQAIATGVHRGSDGALVRGVGSHHEEALEPALGRPQRVQVLHALVRQLGEAARVRLGLDERELASALGALGVGDGGAGRSRTLLGAGERGCRGVEPGTGDVDRYLPPLLVELRCDGGGLQLRSGVLLARPLRQRLVLLNPERAEQHLLPLGRGHAEKAGGTGRPEDTGEKEVLRGEVGGGPAVEIPHACAVDERLPAPLHQHLVAHGGVHVVADQQVAHVRLDEAVAPSRAARQRPLRGRRAVQRTGEAELQDARLSRAVLASDSDERPGQGVEVQVNVGEGADAAEADPVESHRLPHR
jgi:hypothetical protein